MSQKLTTAFCVSLIVLAIAARGNAAVIGTATLVKNPPGSPFLAPEAALPAPWVSYQLSLATTAGELIGAVDVTVNGNVLHQRWVENGFGPGGPSETPRGAPADGRADSHLTPPSGSPFGFGPTETNTMSGSPLVTVVGSGPYYGVGNLYGAWGILAASETANIAYLVFRSDNLPNLQISVKAATPTGAPLLTSRGSDLTTIDFFVPEPSTMALLALAMVGGLGVVRRRNG